MPNHSVRDKTYPLLQQGFSISEIRNKTGCSKSAILRHARELKIITQEQLTPRYDWTLVQKAYDGGMTPTGCMEKFKFSSSAWTRAIQTGKIVPNPVRQRKRGNLNEDLTGQRFGKLTVLQQAESNAQGCRRWLCKCECGKEKTWTTGELNYGSTQSCGCNRHKKGRESSFWKGYGEIGGGFWGDIRRRAIKTNIAFEISIEQAWNLFLQQNRRCALSGEPLTMLSKGKRTASLDRIDSSKGYVDGNIQWVHKDLNLMKLDWTQSEFLAWIERVYNHNFQLCQTPA